MPEWKESEKVRREIKPWMVIVGIVLTAGAVMGARFSGILSLRVAPASVEASKPVRSSHAFFFVDQAIKFHPLWTQIAELNNRIESLNAEWQKKLNVETSSIGRDSSVNEQISQLESTLRANNSQVKGTSSSGNARNDGKASEELLLTIHQDIAAKSKELINTAKQRIEAQKVEQEDAYAQYRQKLELEYGQKITTLKLKRCVVEVNSDSRTRTEELTELDTEISKLQSKREALLDVRYQELSMASREFEASTMKAAEDELDKYSANLYSMMEVEQPIIAFQDPQTPSVDKKKQAISKPLVVSSASAAEFASYKKRKAELTNQKDKLSKAIREEVIRMASRVAKQKGYVIQVVSGRRSSVSTKAPDITDEVINQIK